LLKDEELVRVMFYEESKREERVKKTYSFRLRNKGGTRNFHKRAEGSRQGKALYSEATPEFFKYG